MSAQASALETSSGRNASSQDRSTHFAFDHKIFTLPNAHFHLHQADGSVVFGVKLGDLDALLSVPTLRTEFDISKESSDGQLLAIVEKGLRYVKEIRPGDSIPQELLDGTASWSVDEQHRAAAKKRVVAQIGAWLGGEVASLAMIDPKELLKEDESIKELLRSAFDDAADKIGVGRDNRQLVVDKIEGLAREYAYIEALRDRNNQIRQTFLAIGQLARIYKSDSPVLQEIVRIQALLRKPIQGLEASFMQIDGETTDIADGLKSYDAWVKRIRSARDDLNFRLRTWEPMLEMWRNRDQEDTSRLDLIVKETYRFAAFNFPQTQEWRR
jgi:hypothetical protein